MNRRRQIARRRRQFVFGAVVVVLLGISVAVGVGYQGQNRHGRGQLSTDQATAAQSGGTDPMDHGTPSPVTIVDTGAIPGAVIGPDGKPINVYAHASGPADMSPTVRTFPNRVYVPNNEDGTVDVIDPATFQVVDHFAVGREPQHVTPSWDLKTLYVDNDRSNTLTVIDPATGKRGADLPVTDPYNLYFTPDGTKAIVVAERMRRLDIRNPQTWALITSIPIPYSGVDHLDFSADGAYAIASCEFSGWIVKIDMNTLSVVGQLQVGGFPIDVKLSPDGSAFYIANQSRNGVSVVDGTNMTESSFIPTGGGTHGLYVSRDATLLYASNRTGGTVSVISFATRQVVTTWNLGPGASPDMGGVSSDGTQLWLSGRYSGVVYVIDTGTGQLLHTIKVGRGPHGLSLYPQPGRYSIGHTGIFR